MESSIMDLLDTTSSMPSSSENASILDNNNLVLSTPAVASWCEKCFEQAQEMETRLKKSVGIVKKKIIFTDHLIGMYTDVKSALEQAQNQIKTLEQECKRRETDNQLINKQLKALLADRNPTELELQKKEIESLKVENERLNDRIMSFEMTRKMLEDKIDALKEENSQIEFDWKKHNKEKDLLQKDVARLKRNITSLEKDKNTLTKKNKVLQERVGRRRSRGSGSFSHTTDSEHNNSASMEDVKVEAEETTPASTVFKSPLPGKKKKYKRKRTKSQAVSFSDDDESNSVVHDNVSNSKPVETKNDAQLDSEENSSPKAKTRSAKANWLSSSSDTATDIVKPVVATRDMKARLLETKKKRAYRSFCSHPSSIQLKELAEIVNRLKNNEEMKIEEEIFRFCTKHFLEGHESYVVKKIEKLHKSSLTEEMLNQLDELSFESSSEKQPTQKPVKTSEQTNTALDDSLLSSSDDFLPVPDATDPLTIQQKQQPEIPISSENCNVQKEEVSSAAPSNTATENNSRASPPQKISEELASTNSLSTEDKIMTESVSNVGENDTRSPENTEISTTTESVKKVADNLNRPFMSMFSSDDNEDEQVRVNIRSVADGQLSDVKASVSCDGTETPADLLSKNTSKNLSCKNQKKEKSVSKPGSEEVSILASPSTKKASPQQSSVSEFSSDSESDSLPLEELQKSQRQARDSKIPAKPDPKKVTNDYKSSSEASSNDHFPSNTSSTIQLVESQPCTSKHHKVSATTTKKKKTNLKIPEIKIDAVATKRKQVENTPEIASKLLKPNEQSKRDTAKSVFDSPEHPKSMHRVLASLQSLPFSVDSNSAAVSPQIGAEPSYSFLPTDILSDQMSDDNLSADEPETPADPIESMMSPSRLDIILSDMAMLESMEPLSPLQSSKSEISALSDFEDENRMSISPSADLCTAISFSSSVTEMKFQEDSTKVKETAILSSSIVVGKPAPLPISPDCANTQKLLPPVDTPRRFSCEAPVLARTIPTVKRVCKAQSLDPSALSTLPCAEPLKSGQAPVSSSATPLVSDQSESTSSKILPSSVKIVTPTYSGPFKIVGSPVVTPTEKQVNVFPSPESVSQTSNFTDLPTNVNATPMQIAATEPQEITDLFANTTNPQPIEYPGLSKILEEIQSYAVVVYPAKTYAILHQSTVISWLTRLVEISSVHVTHNSVAEYFSSNDNPSSIGVDNLLHNAEYRFVRMIIAVDRVRSDGDKRIIEPIILPAILKLLCKYGYNVLSANSIGYHNDVLINSINRFLLNGKFNNNTTCALIRLLAALSRSIGAAKSVLDFGRYAMLLKSLSSVELLVYDCIACYPEAFSTCFPLAGKLLVYSLSFQTKAFRNASKPDQFKDNIRSRVRQLELLLGWADLDKSVLFDQTQDESTFSMDEQWRPVYDKCMQAIFNAQLQPSTDAKHSDLCTQVLGLSINNINDVFSALEILASIKCLPFVTGEIVDKKFWPWLNTWSRHLSTSDNQEDNKVVSDGCVIAVLHGLCVVLSAVALRQRVRHPTQSISKQVLAYHNTICVLLSNFALRHLKRAPFRVQCATAVTVLKLAYCKPVLSYTTLFDWICASRTLLIDESEAKSKDSGLKVHPLLPHMAAFYPEKSMRKAVTWLETQTKSLRKDKKFASKSLTSCIWG